MAFCHHALEREQLQALVRNDRMLFGRRDAEVAGLGFEGRLSKGLFPDGEVDDVLAEVPL